MCPRLVVENQWYRVGYTGVGGRVAGEVSQVMVRMERNLNAMLGDLVLIL